MQSTVQSVLEQERGQVATYDKGWRYYVCLNQTAVTLKYPTIALSKISSTNTLFSMYQVRVSTSNGIENIAWWTVYQSQIQSDV